jgi:hypothetical protein
MRARRASRARRRCRDANLLRCDAVDWWTLLRTSEADRGRRICITPLWVERARATPAAVTVVSCD